eukprot:12547554-Ditylum_brightwellii.AAC.2
MAKLEESKAKPDGGNTEERRRNNTAVSYTKFEGRCKSLKGYIFDFDPRNIDRCVICQQEIARHIGADFEYGDLIAEAIYTLQTPQLDHPEDTGENTDCVMEEIFKESIQDYIRETRTLKQNIKKAYKLVWGQVLNPLQEKLRGLPNFDDFNSTCNVILLIRAIKTTIHRFDHCEDQYLAVANAIGQFWNLYQGRDMSNQMFLEKFKAIVVVIEDNGGNIELHPALVALEGMLVEGDDDTELTKEQEEEIKKHLPRSS